MRGPARWSSWASGPFPALAAALIARGLPAETPAILAEAVGTPEASTLRSTVAGLAERLSSGIGTKPALIFYGSLADHSDD